MTLLLNSNDRDFYSHLSPDSIEKLPLIMRLRIKRVFFTFDYYGKIINITNGKLINNFKWDNGDFTFSGLGLSCKWVRTGNLNWASTCPGNLVNQDGKILAATVPYACNEIRKDKFIVRILFNINTQRITYKLWCTTELYWHSENIQRLLVLSDENNIIIMRGRTESFYKTIDIINHNNDIEFLIPVFFNYLMDPPMPAG